MGRKSRQKKYANRNIRIVTAVIFFAVFVFGAFVLIRPGIFIIQPSTAFPNGVTIVYHSRGQDLDMFSSPEGICRKLQGVASQSCQDLVLSDTDMILNRKIVQLPYIDWMYRLSIR
jgi:hypothetical protein